MVFIIKLLEGNILPLQNDHWFLSSNYLKILEGDTLPLQNDYWYPLALFFNMLLSHHPVLSGGAVVPSKRFTKPSINPYVVANLSLQKGFPGWIVFFFQIICYQMLQGQIQDTPGITGQSLFTCALCLEKTYPRLL